MILVRMFYPRKTKINIKKTKRKINKNWCWRRRDPMGIFVLVGSKCPQQRVDAIKWGPKTLRASASGGALRCLLRNTVNFSTSAPGGRHLISVYCPKEITIENSTLAPSWNVRNVNKQDCLRLTDSKCQFLVLHTDNSEYKHIFQLN